MNLVTPEAFVRRNTRLRPVPLVPEVSLYLADEPYDIWYLAKEALGGQTGLPLPYWAFAWAGGQALARYVLDHPDAVRDRTVLDLAAGSGLVAIAAAMFGASEVTANDIDALAGASIVVNAEANQVELRVSLDDLLNSEVDFEVILVGDVFYERPLAGRAIAFLRRAQARGASVLVGDPERRYLPRDAVEPLATYDVPVLASLEDVEVKRTTVWRLR